MKRQKGIAVITALVILAICAGLSASMIWQRNLDIKRTANILHLDQAKYYLLGLEYLVKINLKRHPDRFKNNQQDTAAQNQLPVQGGAMTRRLVEGQGRFNLNNLVSVDGNLNRDAVNQFKRICAQLSIDPVIVNAITDWIDPDKKMRGAAGAEDDYYSNLTPPYLSANQYFKSASELLLVKGVTANVYKKLKPYVTALPTSGTTINVNRASWLIIASLTDKMSEAKAKALVKQRQVQKYKSTQAFVEKLDGKVKSSLISVSSQYYRLEATAKIGQSRLTLHSLLLRHKNGNITVLKRTFGMF